MDEEGAEHPLAPIVPESLLAEQPSSVAAASATVIPDSLPFVESSSVEPGVTEEVDYSDPTDPVYSVLTVGLLGIQKSSSIAQEAVTPPQASATPTTNIAQGADTNIAPSSSGVAVRAPDPSADPGQVIEGAGPSAPSRPPRTRAARGGRDKRYQNIRRAYYQGHDQLRTWIFEHSRPKSCNVLGSPYPEKTSIKQVQNTRNCW